MDVAATTRIVPADVQGRMRTAWRTTLGALRDHQRDGMPFFAAALAFHLLLAVVPLLALVLLLGGGAAEDALVSGTDAVLGDERGDAMKALVEGASSGGRVPWGALGVGLLFLYAAGQVFATLESALNRIWDVETEAERGWWKLLRKRFLSFAALTGFAVLLVVSLAGGALLATLLPAWTWVRLALQAILAFGALAFVYKQAPDAHTRWRDVVPAAAGMALLLSAGEALLAGAFARGIQGLYGSIAAVIVAMVWFYYSATLILFGAELAQERAHARGEKPAPESIARPRGDKEEGGAATPRSRPSTGDAPTQAARRRGGQGRGQ